MMPADQDASINDCILWTGAKTPKGYGHRTIGNKQHRAHRVAWAEVHGPIPDGMHVLHKCDNPSCINVDHLFLGTNADNVADKIRKNRQRAVKGQDHPRAKLTEEDVKRIRTDPRSGYQLAKVYGVYPTTINAIRVRKRWRHVP